MMWIKLVILFFVLLESGNIFVLYLKPELKMGNGMGVFKAWLRSHEDPGFHDLARYLVNWVAGTKLIIIGLLIVLLFTADERTLLVSAGVIALTIGSFYWRMFPLISKMDAAGEIDPPGYSRILGGMIFVFTLMFLAAFLMALLT